MPPDFTAAFDALKPILGKHSKRLSTTVDTPTEFIMVTRTPSPFPQHKGQPMFFGAVRLGKAYASFHLMPLYMCPELNHGMSTALKKRMQGKSCFNFKNCPEPEVISELKTLTAAAVKQWDKKKWL